MNQVYRSFKKIIQDTKTLGATYDYLNNVIKPPYEYSDLLRWQWAQALSALDKFVHDVVRIGMIEIYRGIRNTTPKYESFTLPLNILSEMKINNHREILIFEKYILLSNDYKSFQEPDKISDALSFIWNENHKWKCIADFLSKEEKTIKTFLKNAVLRRNQIVHQGDYNGFSVDRQEIFAEDTNEVIIFVEDLGKAIFICVN